MTNLTLSRIINCGLFTLFFFLQISLINAQNIDPKALNILKSSIKKVEDINSLSYSIMYSFSRGNEKSVSVSEIGVSYITKLNKDSILFYLPQSNFRLDTKDSVLIYFYNPTEYISTLEKKDFYTHGVYNIEKINIQDLLPKIEDFEGDFIDSIVFSKEKNQDEYIIDEILKNRSFDNGQVQYKKSFNRYWIDKKSLLPTKRQRFNHSINDLNEEEIQIDDFSISFPDRNPAQSFPIDVFENASLKNKKVENAKDLLSENAETIDLIKVGMFAPNFSGKNIFSQLEEDLRLYKGKVILLDFWYVSCSPCRQLMPILNELNKKYKNKDFMVLGVNFHDKDGDYIKKYIEKMSFTYKQWYQPSEEEKFYGVTAGPTTILIDKTGKIVFVEEGFYENIEETLSKLIDTEINK